jgi:hypothetical protein
MLRSIAALSNSGLSHGPLWTQVVSLNTERIKYWLAVGAQPSDRVAKLLGYAGLLPELPLRTFDPHQSSAFDREKREFVHDAPSSPAPQESKGVTS